MGIEIGAQLDALWRSLFLGAAFALLYDCLLYTSPSPRDA